MTLRYIALSCLVFLSHYPKVYSQETTTSPRQWPIDEIRGESDRETFIKSVCAGDTIRTKEGSIFQVTGSAEIIVSERENGPANVSIPIAFRNKPADLRIPRRVNKQDKDRVNDMIRASRMLLQHDIPTPKILTSRMEEFAVLEAKPTDSISFVTATMNPSLHPNLQVALFKFIRRTAVLGSLEEFHLEHLSYSEKSAEIRINELSGSPASFFADETKVASPFFATDKRILNIPFLSLLEGAISEVVIQSRAELIRFSPGIAKIFDTFRSQFELAQRGCSNKIIVRINQLAAKKAA